MAEATANTPLTAIDQYLTSGWESLKDSGPEAKALYTVMNGVYDLSDQMMEKGGFLVGAVSGGIVSFGGEVVGRQVVYRRGIRPLMVGAANSMQKVMLDSELNRMGVDFGSLDFTTARRTHMSFRFGFMTGTITDPDKRILKLDLAPLAATDTDGNYTLKKRFENAADPYREILKYAGEMVIDAINKSDIDKGEKEKLVTELKTNPDALKAVYFRNIVGWLTEYIMSSPLVDDMGAVDYLISPRLHLGKKEESELDKMRDGVGIHGFERDEAPLNYYMFPKEFPQLVLPGGVLGAIRLTHLWKEDLSAPPPPIYVPSQELVDLRAAAGFGPDGEYYPDLALASLPELFEGLGDKSFLTRLLAENNIPESVYQTWVTAGNPQAEMFRMLAFDIMRAVIDPENKIWDVVSERMSRADKHEKDDKKVKPNNRRFSSNTKDMAKFNRWLQPGGVDGEYVDVLPGELVGEMSDPGGAKYEGYSLITSLGVASEANRVYEIFYDKKGKEIDYPNIFTGAKLSDQFLSLSKDLETLFVAINNYPAGDLKDAALKTFKPLAKKVLDAVKDRVKAYGLSNFEAYLTKWNTYGRTWEWMKIDGHALSDPLETQVIDDLKPELAAVTDVAARKILMEVLRLHENEKVTGAYDKFQESLKKMEEAAAKAKQAAETVERKYANPNFLSTMTADEVGSAYLELARLRQELSDGVLEAAAEFGAINTLVAQPGIGLRNMADLKRASNIQTLTLYPIDNRARGALASRVAAVEKLKVSLDDAWSGNTIYTNLSTLGGPTVNLETYITDPANNIVDKTRSWAYGRLFENRLRLTDPAVIKRTGKTVTQLRIIAGEAKNFPMDSLMQTRYAQVIQMIGREDTNAGPPVPVPQSPDQVEWARLIGRDAGLQAPPAPIPTPPLGHLQGSGFPGGPATDTASRRLLYMVSSAVAASETGLNEAIEMVYSKLFTNYPADWSPGVMTQDAAYKLIARFMIDMLEGKTAGLDKYEINPGPPPTVGNWLKRNGGNSDVQVTTVERRFIDQALAA